MAAYRDLGRKISSLQNMQKVTRAMNMISSIKLKKYMVIQEPLSRFHQEIDLMCNRVLERTRETEHSLTTGYPQVKRVHLVLYTGDKGLCGNHNNRVIKSLEYFTQALKKENKELELTCLGQKGIQYAQRHGYKVRHQIKMTEKTLTPQRIETLSRDLYQLYITGEIQQIFLLGNLFVSTLQKDTTRQQILPLVPSDAPEEEEVLEGELGSIPLLERFCQSYLQDKITVFMNSSYLSEHSSRLTSMENATSNAEDLINKYTNLENHARQGAITDELIEIISGKEALKD